MSVVDVFVVLDCVDLPNQNSFVNRTRIVLNGKVTWLTCSVQRPQGSSQTIARTCFTDETQWRQKIVNRINAAYRHHPFFELVMEHLEPHILNPNIELVPYNLGLIQTVRSLLSIKTPLVMASDLGCEGRRSELMADLTTRAGCDVYMYGKGGAAYQTPEPFVCRSLTLKPQNFLHPRYPQLALETFVDGLSVVDALMNLGPDGTKRMLREA